MSNRWQKLEATYARRREAEHNRVERTEAINRYYDHWDKVTARYQTWCGPEYYSRAEEKLKLEKEKKEKAELLLQRREKMRKLLDAERIAHEELLREQRRPNSRKVNATTELLEKIDHNMKDRANMRKKLELEARLYGRWRYGVDDEHRLFETKNDHQVLAKLNWLDKQIENEQLREQEQKETEERNLRLQSELAKIEESQKERQIIRKQEIKEIHALQEKHMAELHKRQKEADLLKDTEHSIRMFLDELGKERRLLDESSTMIMEPDGHFSQSFNLRKIKIYIRKRSELFRRHIKLSLGILERMEAYARNCKKIKALKDKYKEQQDAESQLMAQVDSMYESEAKYNLQCWEDQWQAQHRTRYQELKELLTNKISSFKEQLSDNLQRQQDIIGIRNTHLTAIEHTSEELKELIKEQDESPRVVVENEQETPNKGVGANSVFLTSAATLPSELAVHNVKSPHTYSELAAGKSSESIKSPREFLEPHNKQYPAHKRAASVKSPSEFSEPAAGKSSESINSPRDHKLCKPSEPAAGTTAREFFEPEKNRHFANSRAASVKSPFDYSDKKVANSLKSPHAYSEPVAGKSSESMKSPRAFLEPHNNKPHSLTAGMTMNPSEPAAGRTSESMAAPCDFLGPHKKHFSTSGSPREDILPVRCSPSQSNRTSLDFPFKYLGAAGLALTDAEPLKPCLKSTHRAPTVFSATSCDKIDLQLPAAHCSSRTMTHMSSSFEHLNLDTADDVTSPRSGAAELRLQNTRLDNVVNAANAEPPKFGRKRVAWT